MQLSYWLLWDVALVQFLRLLLHIHMAFIGLFKGELIHKTHMCKNEIYFILNLLHQPKVS